MSKVLPSDWCVEVWPGLMIQHFYSQHRNEFRILFGQVVPLPLRKREYFPSGSGEAAAAELEGRDRGGFSMGRRECRGYLSQEGE